MAFGNLTQRRHGVSQMGGRRRRSASIIPCPFTDHRKPQMTTGPLAMPDHSAHPRALEH